MKKENLMLLLISPAKTLNTSPSRRDMPGTQPAFWNDAIQLARELKKRNEEELGKLLDISPVLARINAERLQRFSEDPACPAGKYAAEMYRGDTYEDLNVASWRSDDWQTAQQSLCILSGLYGVLRPLDLIQPYRLEMRSPLATDRGRDLYAFWGKRLSEYIASLAVNRTVINLASEEYIKAVRDVPMITPLFKELRQGKLLTISLRAKRARGAMARFMITRRLTEPNALKAFTEGGYRFQENLSDSTHWLFVRAESSEKPLVETGLAGSARQM
ncbi:MAG: YaaA family protein [Magnetococcales bacterium]|nr:YaaA family protein [Magnetococcales bacterium]